METHHSDTRNTRNEYKLHAKLGYGKEDKGPFMEVQGWPVLGNITKKLWYYNSRKECAVVLYYFHGQTWWELHVRAQQLARRPNYDSICSKMFLELCRRSLPVREVYSTGCRRK
ncbi:hypothetical protein MTO96_007884 [Rhipicephalus appendiculatus]